MEDDSQLVVMAGNGNEKWGSSAAYRTFCSQFNSQRKRRDNSGWKRKNIVLRMIRINDETYDLVESYLDKQASERKLVRRCRWNEWGCSSVPPSGAHRSVGIEHTIGGTECVRKEQRVDCPGGEVKLLGNFPITHCRYRRYFFKNLLRLTSVRTHRIGIPIKIEAIKIGEMRRAQPSGVTITKWNSSIEYHSRKGAKLIFVRYRCSYIFLPSLRRIKHGDLVMVYRQTVCKQTIIRRFLALRIVTEKRTRWCDVQCFVRWGGAKD